MSRDRRRLRAPVASGAGVATAIVRVLDTQAIEVDDVQVHQSSLDDFFFALTGHGVEPEPLVLDERAVRMTSFPSCSA